MSVRNLAKFASAAIGFGMVLAATQAGAVTYTVNSATIDPNAGSENGTVHADATTNPSHSALNEDAAIGRILLTGTTSAGASFSFDSFCVDIYDFLGAPATFTGDTLASLGLSPTKTTQLTNLLANIDTYIDSGNNWAANADPSLTGSKADRSAAAQLAVWEIISETSNVFDVDGTASDKGAFYVTNVGGDNVTPTALKDAATLLSDVKSGYFTNASNIQVALVRSSGNQTQVIYGSNALTVLSAIPEPATWGLMVLGFGAIGGALRRKKVSFATIA